MEVLQSFITRLKSVPSSPSPELRHVLEDALTALEIKEEELALRSHIARQEKKNTTKNEDLREDKKTNTNHQEKEKIKHPTKPSTNHIKENGSSSSSDNKSLKNQNQTSTSETKSSSSSSSTSNVQKSEKTLQQLGRVAAVRARLKEALSSNNIEELETAIEMAEQWENSQLHCEIQAASDMIRKLSLASDEKSNQDNKEEPIGSSPIYHKKEDNPETEAEKEKVSFHCTTKI